MLLKPLPENLDYLVLNDHLFQTLRKSKQTKHLINLRAEQIVKQLLRDSLETEIYHKYRQSLEKAHQAEQICEKLQKQIQVLKQKQEKSKKSLIKELKYENQNILIKANAQLENKDQRIQSLQTEIQNLQQTLSELQESFRKLEEDCRSKDEYNQKLLKKVQRYEVQTKQLENFKENSKRQMQKILFSHQEQMEKSFNKQKTLSTTITELEQKLKAATEQIQALQHQLGSRDSAESQNCKKLETQLKRSHRQIDKLKKELNDAEENYQLLKKEINRFKDKYRKFEEQYNQIQITHSQQEKQNNSKISTQLEEIATLNQKIQQLNNKNQNLTKTNSILRTSVQRFQRIVSTSLLALKQQNFTLRSFITQSFLLIKEHTETNFMKVVNHLSSSLSQYFQECIYEIKKGREQKNLLKQEVKMKSEVIEHLDKVLNNEAKSVFELRYELRQKIKEEEKLRRRLKSHYNETDRKLEEFQNKYISILKSDF